MCCLEVLRIPECKFNKHLFNIWAVSTAGAGLGLGPLLLTPVTVSTRNWDVTETFQYSVRKWHDKRDSGIIEAHSRTKALVKKQQGWTAAQRCVDVCMYVCMWKVRGSWLRSSIRPSTEEAEKCLWAMKWRNKSGSQRLSPREENWSWNRDSGDREGSTGGSKDKHFVRIREADVVPFSRGNMSTGARGVLLCPCPQGWLPNWCVSKNMGFCKGLDFYLFLRFLSIPPPMWIQQIDISLAIVNKSWFNKWEREVGPQSGTEGLSPQYPLPSLLSFLPSCSFIVNLKLLLKKKLQGRYGGNSVKVQVIWE